MKERHRMREKELEKELEVSRQEVVKLRDELEDGKETLKYLTTASHVYSPRKARYTESAV